MTTEGLGHLKLSKDPTGNRARYLPSCGAAPQQLRHRSPCLLRHSCMTAFKQSSRHIAKHKAPSHLFQEEAYIQQRKLRVFRITYVGRIILKWIFKSAKRMGLIHLAENTKQCRALWTLSLSRKAGGNLSANWAERVLACQERLCLMETQKCI